MLEASSVLKTNGGESWVFYSKSGCLCLRWSLMSMTHYWFGDSSHELRCRFRPSPGVMSTPSCDVLRSPGQSVSGDWSTLEGISRLHCQWLITDVVSHCLCSMMLIHSGHRWPPLLLFHTICLLSKMWTLTSSKDCPLSCKCKCSPL